VAKAAKITLEIADGEFILNPEVLIINAHGLENIQGFRNAKDGCV
jgi:hypothetical protein